MDREKIKDFFMQVGPLRLILVGICGIFLVLVSLPKTDGDNEDKKTQKETTALVQQNENEVYVKELEKRLVETLEQVEGVGKVQVMITLLSSKEIIVNKDNPYEESETQGETNSEKKVNQQEQTVLITEDGEEVPYVIKEIEPEIGGVMVVTEGGGDPVIVSQVTEAVQVLFHVEAHKIKVLKMEDGS